MQRYSHSVIQPHSYTATYSHSYTATELYNHAAIQPCSYTVTQLYSHKAIVPCSFTATPLYSHTPIQPHSYTVTPLYSHTATVTHPCSQCTNFLCFDKVLSWKSSTVSQFCHSLPKRGTSYLRQIAKYLQLRVLTQTFLLYRQVPSSPEADLVMVPSWPLDTCAPGTHFR